jgi:hypothetical protein
MGPVFLFNGTTFVANPLETGCTNDAIVGGRINSIDPTIPSVSPMRVGTQVALAGAAGFTATDLLLIDGGGNDAADLIGAFLTLQQNLASTTFFDLATSLLTVRRWHHRRRRCRATRRPVHAVDPGLQRPAGKPRGRG